ncbi:MAG: TrmB family transcriptional regulator [Halorubrum sp.]
MNRSELVTVLEDAGLSPYQADAYVAVLELGSAPATAIADRSSVPDQRIYDVLRDLDDKGYVEIYEQESLYARAYSLEDVIDDLQSRAERFSTAASEIERRWTEPELEASAVSIVKQFETVLNNAQEAIRDASSQVQISLDLDHYERFAPDLAAALDDGVQVNLSLHTGDPDDLPSEDELADVCTEARFRRLPSPFVAIVDRTKTCFSPHAGSTNEYGVLVEDRTHTYVFHWFFLTTQWDIWEQVYADVDDVPPIDYADIRYCVQDVLPLIEEGATVTVHIVGADTETGAKRVIDGAVREVILTDDSPREHGSIATYGGQVGLLVETEDGPIEVGGWGAMIEEVEAHRITLVSVSD